MTRSETASSYRVLARKYRPQVFKDLIGQETLVSVLTQALLANRMPHALILTGVRGVGKTTSARIIARALNCVGRTIQDSSTVDPCGTCSHCHAILEDRLIDVIEMDAASRTGVDDIRSVIETAHYRPVSAPYKVFIIDEVHMLSKNAFNALLKTLEEPPQHVVFIFATTEIRKVPDTVLSRCIRFDLRRLIPQDLQTLLQRVLKAEGFKAEPEALRLLARKADGSARDALSLLDQALNLSPQQVTEEAVRQMLHLTDGLALVKVFTALIEGNLPLLLEAPRQTYTHGGDPLTLLQDLASMCHHLSLLKTHPPLIADTFTTEENQALVALAEKLSVPVLARLWQGLIKGIQETELYPQPVQSAEMVLLRLAYLSLLPTPHEVIESLGSGKERSLSLTPSTLPVVEPDSLRPLDITLKETSLTGLCTLPSTFMELVKLVGDQRELIMQGTLRHDVHLINYQPGHMILRPTSRMPKDFVLRLKNKLMEWTGQVWIIEVTTEAEGHPTLKEQEVLQEKKLKEEVHQDPLVKEALAIFPDAHIESIENGEGL